MRRLASTPRAGWRETVRSQGLVYAEDVRYWDETAAYAFSMAEVLQLEEQTEQLYEMCLTAAGHVIETNRLADFGVPAWAHDAVRSSWREQPPSLYGRFDLRYDGNGKPKLLEFNGDTPTSVLEAAIIQWFWLQDTHPANDQWNSLHESLVATWQKFALDGPVHFAWSNLEETYEDLMTVGYLAETAHQAGLEIKVTPMLDIAWDGREFRDSAGDPLRTCFKLYPWEWMLAEPYGRLALEPGTPTTWIEPSWKLLLSNKALLAILWELYPGHELLLPAYLDGPRELSAYVAKPLHGREGAGITINETPGAGHCYQEWMPLPDFDGNHPVLGSWIVGGEAAGLGIRESAGLITDSSARFVPHYIL